MFLRKKMKNSKISYSDKLLKIKEQMEQADAIVIGAGAGLSTSAGFNYSGERFEQYFSDFREKYGFEDMYSGGFYSYDTLEQYWAYWSRYIYINRYMNPPTSLYHNIFKLVQNKDYFVLTTNVDHCFQKVGFDKNRLFYTQGDYGLFQCSKPCHYKTYDNEEVIKKMVLSQGFKIEDGKLVQPKETRIKLTVPMRLIPKCPRCGCFMTMNLRTDNTFVQDEGWDKAARRYKNFIENHRGKKVVFIELGVGYNTPGVIKYTFWKYAYNFKNTFYICINKGQAYVPYEIEDKSIGIDSDILEVVNDLKIALDK